MALRWMDYSGAPALLLPRAALAHWHGILSRTPDDAGAPADFTDADGGEWFTHDAFDFANPRTHYDELCGAFERDGRYERVIDVGATQAFAVSNGDDSAAWWPERTALLTGAERKPSEKTWKAAAWEPCGELSVGEREWVLMNSSVHGGQLLAGDEDSEYVSVTLEPGRYRVERAHFEGTSAYRFLRVHPAG